MKTRGRGDTLLLGKQVEVRSIEDGFLGSWHSGEIVSFSEGSPVVEYHHILSDVKDDNVNASDIIDVDDDNCCVKMIETVQFCDGEGVCDDGLGLNYRGSIRPMNRPVVGVNVGDLEYGECVDVLYKDAWWEGVIFDRVVGGEERKVFFPDMGDEMRVSVSGGGGGVRVSQDWDERSGEWRVRGKWLFLELVDEFEKECWPLLVSVKQIWYDVRVKKGFEKDVKEWTSCESDVWRALLFEVVMDNLKITMEGFLKTVEVSEQKGLEESYRFLELNGTGLYGLLKSKGFDEISGDGVVSDVDSGRLDTLPVCSSVKPMFQNDAPCASSLKLATVPSDMDDKLSMNESCNSSCKVSKKSTKRVWVSGDIVPEYCADAIEEYSTVYCKASKTRRDLHVAELNLRKHLVFLGWKAEYFQDKGFRRWRYAQPNGSKKYFSSLLTVCEHLKKSDSAKVSLFPQDEQNRLSNASDITVVSPLYEQSHGCNDEQIKDFPDYDSGLIEPEYCPQAVINYYSCVIKENGYLRDHDKVKDMQLKAKKHLSAVGWKLFYTYENNMRSKELTYSSPCGKLYFSLRSACKGFLDEKRDVVKLAEAQLLGEGVCSSLETKEYQVKHEKKRKSSVLYPGYSSRSAKSLKKKKNSMEVQDRDKSNCVVENRVSGSRKRAREIDVLSPYPRIRRTVWSWLIEEKAIHLGQLVQYIRDGKNMKTGTISCDGITCDCCREIFTISNFEVHNIGTRCQPSVNIWVLNDRSGKSLHEPQSLHECQMKLRQKIIAKEATKELKAIKKYQNKDDDICSICHSWGQLICCDGCPSAFHECCLGLKEVPGGNWYCPSCCCKTCGLGVNNGHIEVSKEVGVMNCHQCKLRYHIGCRTMKDSVPTSHSRGYSFCSEKCEDISFQLENRLGKAVPVGTANLTWTLLKYVEPDECDHDPSSIADSIDNYCKLNVALRVMQECFEPMKEPRTKSDLVKDVIFSRWSELNRLNFSGFYTVLLEKNEELISVATVRIYGDKVAEMPLVATRFVYRKKGMCRILMNELEKVLTEVGVERLVLPAAESVLDTWTSSFGFSKMPQSERLKLLDFTFLEFQGTTMCQKLLKTACIESSPPRSIKQQCGVANRNVDIDLEGSISSVSEMLQTEGVVGQSSIDLGGGSGCSTGSEFITQGEICPKSSLEGGTDCKKAVNCAKAELKCYKRRGISKPGGAKLSVC
ncbi:Chromodomain-helicase-DNA-binding protein 3-like [Heracleum sosnowskyi]|uniref:Chromodomain-helicase-DNA-binding protein 3-like n=1 Tax=Heracleum sosnowskyi TaxID=360622 RepID=A0AAD8MM00_9APIA|nr:Chromodomain-helicase-DNA-binding protein 3-like [Heracleum sosnowskyi]